MSRQDENLKEYIRNEAIVHKYLEKHGVKFLNKGDIFAIVQDELELEYQEVIHARLSVDSIQDIVVGLIERNGVMIGKVSQDLGEDGIDWTPIESNKIQKAQLKNDGQIWVVHQNDADPHPSIPHAHNYQQNLKLNLYNGSLYQKTMYVGKMKDKELSELVFKIKLNFPRIKFKDK